MAKGEIGACHLAQSAYNAVAPEPLIQLVEDGHIGPGTVGQLNLLAQMGMEATFVAKFCVLRLAEYESRIAKWPKLAKFRGTWTERCNPLV